MVNQSPFSNLKQDAPSALVVFLVALPLCLGIALASGAPLFSGLIAGIIGGLIVAPLSGSPLGVSGPAAGLAVIVYGAIEELGRRRGRRTTSRRWRCPTSAGRRPRTENRRPSTCASAAGCLGWRRCRIRARWGRRAAGCRADP